MEFATADKQFFLSGLKNVAANASLGVSNFMTNNVGLINGLSGAVSGGIGGYQIGSMFGGSSSVPGGTAPNTNAGLFNTPPVRPTPTVPHVGQGPSAPPATPIVISAPAPVPVAPPKESNNTMLIIGGVAILIVIVAAALMMKK